MYLLSINVNMICINSSPPYRRWRLLDIVILNLYKAFKASQVSVREPKEGISNRLTKLGKF